MTYFILFITIISLSLSNSNTNDISLTVIEDQKNLKQSIKIQEIKAGTLVRKISGTNEYELIPQIETDVTIDIQGMVSSTIMDQIYINNSDKPIEAMYVFPLNHHAAIHDMYFIIDNRIVKSKIEEKKEAKKQYNQAKQEGKRASLLKQERPNMFTQSIANIMPNDTIMVRIKYVEELKYENQEFELRLPLAITPRYTMGGVESKFDIKDGTIKKTSTSVEKAKDIQPPFTPPSIEASKGVSININLDGGIPVENVSSSHQIIEKKISPNKRQIKLKNGRITPDQDFTLKYRIGSKDEAQVTTFISEQDGEDYYMIMAIPPDPKKNKEYIPKEMTFVLDVSGSMNGNNIKYAKLSLLESLDKLSPKDYFNIIAFDDKTYQYQYNPIPATEENVLDGMDFINNIKGGGGTNALPALAWALDEHHNPDFMKMIIFISDGGLGYENEVFKLINNSQSDARIFSINIGYAPNNFLLEKVAEMTRGTYIYIKNNRDIVDKIAKLTNKINSPIISDIQIKLDNTADAYPNPISDLYHKEPIVIFGKSDNLKNKITLTGKTSKGNYKKTFKIKKRKIKEHASIPTLWARKKIESLMNHYRLKSNKVNKTKDDLKNEIIEISKKYNVLSKFTSFIAVEDIITNNTGELLSGNVPLELPKNWEYRQAPQYDKNQQNTFKYANATNKYSPSMPSTATNNPTYLLLGSLLFLCAMLLSRIRKTLNEKHSVKIFN